MAARAENRSSRPLSSSSRSTATSCPLLSSSSWLLSSGVATTLCVPMPNDRPYSDLLSQTQVVYDHLLSERQRKLQQKINDRQHEYMDKHRHLSKTDRVKAVEFERWAAEALSHLKDECVKELNDLRQDYESKFIKLRISLEEQWVTDHHMMPSAATHHHHHLLPPQHLPKRH